MKRKRESEKKEWWIFLLLFLSPILPLFLFPHSPILPLSLLGLTFFWFWALLVCLLN